MKTVLAAAVGLVWALALLVQPQEHARRQWWMPSQRGQISTAVDTPWQFGRR